MAEDLDVVARYGKSVGLEVRPRTILVEGTTDAELFQLAARLERTSTGIDLFAGGLAILAAGVGNAGGWKGVILELHRFRGLSKACLLPNGNPRYRFVGLFDNDQAGQRAVPYARDLDTSILEYRDVFRLWPVMPCPANLDPMGLRRAFEAANDPYRSLEWELEDLLPSDLVDEFVSDNPYAIKNSKTVNGKVHRNLTPEGKARLHHFVKLHAIHRDLGGVLDVLKALRLYLGLK